MLTPISSSFGFYSFTESNPVFVKLCLVGKLIFRFELGLKLISGKNDSPVFTN
jgi:hypothetical protein